MNSVRIFTLFSMLSVFSVVTPHAAPAKPVASVLANGRCNHAFCCQKRFIANDLAFANFVEELATFDERDATHSKNAKGWNIATLITTLLGLGSGAAIGGLAKRLATTDLSKPNQPNAIVRAIVGGIIGGLGTFGVTKLLQVIFIGFAPHRPFLSYTKECLVADYIATLEHYQNVLRSNVRPWLDINSSGEQYALNGVANHVRHQHPEYPYLNAETILCNFIAELRNVAQAAEYMLTTQENLAHDTSGLVIAGVSLETWRRQSQIILQEVQAAISQLDFLKNLINGSYQYQAEYKQRQQQREIERLQQEKLERERQLQEETARRQRAEYEAQEQRVRVLREQSENERTRIIERERQQQEDSMRRQRADYEAQERIARARREQEENERIRLAARNLAEREVMERRLAAEREVARQRQQALEREYEQQRRQELEVQRATYNSFESEKKRKEEAQRRHERGASASEISNQETEINYWSEQKRKKAQYNEPAKKDSTAKASENNFSSQEEALNYWNEQKRKKDLEAAAAAKNKVIDTSNASANYSDNSSKGKNVHSEQEAELNYWNEQKRKKDAQTAASVQAQTATVVAQAPRTTSSSSQASTASQAASEQEAPECSICLENITSGKTTTRCGHHFHSACLNNWKSGGHSTCPNCRGNL